MSDRTARFNLPMLQPGQAQKEVFHNESLTLIDAAMHPAVESRGENVPPATPIFGASWIIGASPVGEWLNRAENLACWTEGGWRFIPPVEGMRIWRRDIELFSVWTGSAWQDGVIRAEYVEIEGKTVIRRQQSAIEDPSGGAIADVEARAVTASILAVMRAHGLIAT